MKTKEGFLFSNAIWFCTKTFRRKGALLKKEKKEVSWIVYLKSQKGLSTRITVHKLCLWYKRRIQSSVFEYLFKVIDSDRLDEIKEMNVYNLIYQNYWIQIIFGHPDDSIKYTESVSFERKNRCLTLNVCLSNTWFFCVIWFIINAIKFIVFIIDIEDICIARH